MAGDKGAEARIAQHNIEGVLKKNIPDGSTLGEIRDKLNARPIDFGEKEGFKTLSDETRRQMQEALDRHARPKGPSAAFKRAISGAWGKIRRGRQLPNNETTAAGPLPTNETAQRFADRMNSGSTQEAHDYSSQGRTRNVRTNPITDFNLRANFEPMSDRGQADETPKPSEE